MEKILIVNSFLTFSLILAEGDLPKSSVKRVKGQLNCIGKSKIQDKKAKPGLNSAKGNSAHLPSIFTVFVEKQDHNRIVSFNYIDILTNNVESYICDDMETRIVRVDDSEAILIVY